MKISLNSLLNKTSLKVFFCFRIIHKINIIYSENATNFCEISTLLLTVCTVVKSKVEISQNFVAFSEYMNFTNFLVCAVILWNNKFCFVTLSCFQLSRHLLMFCSQHEPSNSVVVKRFESLLHFLLSSIKSQTMLQKLFARLNTALSFLRGDTKTEN